MENELRDIYRNRFQGKLENRNRIWKILCTEYFQKFINSEKDTVLDIASGYGEFINNIRAKKKIAIDLNGDTRKYVKNEVEIIISDCKKIEKLQENSVDKIFISNFLEHLNNTDEVLMVLRECKRILKVGGKIMILQPNIYYVKEKYWFFIDHKTPLTHESLKEALEVAGFKILFLKKKFLPYSMKSNFPQCDLFIKIYLKLPILQWIFGKQIFIIGIKN